MNYLAHSLLSGPDDELRLGNFLGDFVKGRVENYRGTHVSERLRDGIRLHRAIDSFTDQHRIVRRSKTLLSTRYGLRSGVIVDLAYDHFLAKNWKAFSAQELNEFSAKFFNLLKMNLFRIDQSVHPLIFAMSQHNWLISYSRLEGLDRALSGMARRFPVAAGIETAGEEIRAQYTNFEADFQEFFPQILDFCKAYW